MPEPHKKHIFVLGAGVVGLSTAIQLLRHPVLGKEYQVTIISELWPGDERSIKYTSGWAGAHHVSTAETGLQRGLDKETFDIMWKEAHENPDIPLMVAQQWEYFDKEPAPEAISRYIGEYMPNFRYLTPDELIPGAAHGSTFTTITIDTPKYLLYLLNIYESLSPSPESSRIRLQIPSIASLLAPSESLLEIPSVPTAIINCLGIGAHSLPGVEDKAVYPTRGQTVVIEAPWVKRGVTFTGKLDVPSDVTYVIPRKGGEVILGGTRLDNDWDPIPRKDVTDRIISRCLALCPELLPPDKRSSSLLPKDGRGEAKPEDLKILYEGCGLRPSRKGGVRIETEWLDLPESKGKIPLVHNYGHGGMGYQSSWGSANAAVKLLDKALTTQA